MISFVDTRVTITSGSSKNLELEMLRPFSFCTKQKEYLERCFRRDNVIETVHICKSLASIACLLQVNNPVLGFRFPTIAPTRRGGGKKKKKKEKRKLPHECGTSTLPRCIEHEDSHRLRVDALPFHLAKVKPVKFAGWDVLVDSGCLSLRSRSLLRVFMQLAGFF